MWSSIRTPRSEWCAPRWCRAQALRTSGTCSTTGPLPPASATASTRRRSASSPSTSSQSAGYAAYAPRFGRTATADSHASAGEVELLRRPAAGQAARVQGDAGGRDLRAVRRGRAPREDAGRARDRPRIRGKARGGAGDVRPDDAAVRVAARPVDAGPRAAVPDCTCGTARRSRPPSRSRCRSRTRYRSGASRSA